MRINPARLDFDPTGAPFSLDFNDVYRSREGALAESHEVFVGGTKLRERWSGRADFTVLEVGFGLGLNLLASAQALQGDPAGPGRLHYVSLEALPLDRSDLLRAHRALGVDRSPLMKELVERWPHRLPGLHRLELAGGRLICLIGFGAAGKLLPKLDVRADAIYLDGFAPAKNPDAWSPTLMRQLARRSVKGTTLATYSAAASVRVALAEAGFEVSLVPGFATKRERIDACYSPRWRTWPEPLPAPRWSQRRAVVVGAGLAGCSTATVLSEHGWQVTLIEQAAAPMTGGSGQPLLADHIHLSPDDNLTARLTRAALLLRGSAPGAAPIGRLTIAESVEDEARQDELLRKLGFPEEFAQALDRSKASEVAGVELRHGALWLPKCSVSDPLAITESLLRRNHARIDALSGTRVAGMAKPDELWRLYGNDGAEIARAPVVVLCTATLPPGVDSRLLPLLRRTRGQTSWVKHPGLSNLKTVLGGAAYAVPSGDRVLIGATYDESSDPSTDPLNDLSNAGRLARALGWDPATIARCCDSAVVGMRWNSPDRLPLIGELPDTERVLAMVPELLRNDRLPVPRNAGLFMIGALGSRGLLWSVLGAQIIAAYLEGWPSPIETDLLRAVDPTRRVRANLRYLPSAR